MTVEHIFYDENNSNCLKHYGVKGMRWGVRKNENKSSDHFNVRSTVSKNGDTITLKRNSGSKVLQKFSKRYRKFLNDNYDYDLFLNDKKVGNFSMRQKNNKEMNIVWGEIYDDYRNKGYMTAVMKEGERIAKELGNEKITGELVGNSPGNSIHKLADNQRYIKTGEIKSSDVMATWGGLTLVEKKLT